MENEAKRLRMQEKLTNARARAKILENVEFGEEQEKYCEIINNLCFPGKPRKRALNSHSVNKIVII